MKNICIIMPGRLPIPNINGGAIETLITSLLDTNEENQKVKFTVISPYAPGVEEVIKKYKNTKFIYVSPPNILLRKFINLFNYIIAITTKNIDFFPTPFHWSVKKIMDNVNADAVVVEHGVFKHFGFLRKKYNRNQLYLHWHSADGKLDYKTVKLFGHFIGVSNYVCDIYKPLLEKHKTKIHVCFNGIDDDIFSQRISLEERKCLRKNYRVSENDLLIIYCGRLIKWKGVKEIIKGVIATQNEHIKLMIIGSSNFKNAKKKRYEKDLDGLIKGYDKQVFFTGYISNTELYRFYQSSDLQIVCSICEEAAGLVAIEGMMSGLPLIITNSGGLTEYVSPNCSILLEKGDSLHNEQDSENLSEQITQVLIDLWRDRKKTKNLATHSMENAKFFNKNHFFEHFISCLDECN